MLKKMRSFEIIFGVTKLMVTWCDPKEIGPVLFLLKLSDGRVRHCHLEQIHKCSMGYLMILYFEPEISDSLMYLPHLWMKV